MINHKKYFTKYFPVEGELEVGHITKWDSNEGYYAGQFLKVTESFLHHAQASQWKRYKLFLCRRNIQVGDRFTFEASSEGVDICIKIEGDIVIGEKFSSKKKSQFPHLQIFSIIGEISKKAIWVTEGMEFDDEEVHWKSPDNILIKCPTCKTYH